MAEWNLWLDEHQLAPVPHRQVVLTLPKRLRAYFLHDRRRLGLLSQVAARTLRDYVQATYAGIHRMRMVYAGDVEVCPRCGGAARNIGFVTQPTAIARLLAHLGQRGGDARAGPWAGAAAPG